MRCEIGNVFTHLCPNKFNRIELWSTDRKVINMHTRILGKKLLHKLTLVDGMVVPHQNDLARNDPQNLLQESDHLFATQAAPIGTCGQLDLSAIQTHQQCTQHVQPLVMLQAGTNSRCASTWRPTALERRDQREAAFIYKNQPSPQFTPLFLSLARPAASRKRSPPRRVGSPGAAASGCSNPCDLSRVRRRWEHTEFRIVPKSRARSAPASSNPLHIRGHMLRVTILAPTSAVVRWSTWWDDQAVAHFSSAGCLAVPASERHCGW